MFDVNYYTAKLSWAEQKVIDNFFDSLSWENLTENPQVDIQNYGVLMTMVDFNNRYTYRGSVTTPPCARFVHWNVLSTVYPIS
jgi:carbonic anhydrase